MGIFIVLAISIQGNAADLRWNILQRTVVVGVADTNAPVVFWMTNNSDRPITVVRIKPSCGCTTTGDTKLPMTLSPGSARMIGLDTDVRGKRGILNKSAQVFSSAGVQELRFKIAIGLESQAMSRSSNRVIAEADRQAVFRGKCAECHSKPANGKHGKELYRAACGICHEAEHRASMVPDLRKQGLPESSLLESLIRHGKPNSLMPAFHEAEGGPLTSEQVQSLAEFLTQEFKVEAQE